MKAITHTRYGTPDVLSLQNIERPAPGDDEVLVKVEAAGVDQGVWHLVAGMPQAVRLAIGLRAPKNQTPGADLAGRVESVGSRVTRFSPGDEVFGVGSSAFAEFAVAKEAKLAHKPATLSFAEAAVLPISGMTALHAVRDAARVSPGQRVLVLGAGGGVGSFAVQLAKASGAHVTGVCSAGKLDLVRSLGADAVIDYRSEALDRDRQPFDAIIDTAGHRTVRSLRELLTASGVLVIVGSENAGGRMLGGLERAIGAALRSPFVKHKLVMLASSEDAAGLETLAEHVARGELRPPLDRSYPLADAAQALHDLRAGLIRGKAAIVMG